MLYEIKIPKDLFVPKNVCLRALCLFSTIYLCVLFVACSSTTPRAENPMQRESPAVDGSTHGEQHGVQDTPSTERARRTEMTRPDPTLGQDAAPEFGEPDPDAQPEQAPHKDTTRHDRSSGNDPSPKRETNQPDPGQGNAVFYLYDDNTNQFLAPIGKSLDLKRYTPYKELNIALKVDNRVKSVRFTFDKTPSRTESIAVFTVFRGGADHRDKLTQGHHTVSAVTYSETKATGKLLDRVTLQFTITDTGGSSGGYTLPKDPKVVPSDPTFSQSKNVTQTIVLTKPGVYDYKNVLHIWKGKGSCNQTENQPHILRIQASDVTVKNFAYRNAPDGIHIATCGKGQGNTCTGRISNITLDHVVGWACEDALTTGRGTSNITIKNSWFLGNPNTNFRDKCIQLNFADNLTIQSTIFKNCKRPIRFKSGSKIHLVGNRFYIFQHAVKGDTYKDITNIVPNRQATVTADKNHFQEGDYAYYMEGKIAVQSTQDVFHQVKTQKFTKDGASIKIR